MLQHLVLLRFKPGTAAADVAAIEAAFCALRTRVPGVEALEWGLDSSPEGLAKGFTHAFLLSFAGAGQRDAYLPHPAHQAFVAQLKPVLDDVLVLDYEATATG